MNYVNLNIIIQFLGGNLKKILFILFILCFVFIYADKEESDACTTITAGKAATIDGSVMTSHTCDSRTTRTWIDIVPQKKHKQGSKRMVHEK